MLLVQPASTRLAELKDIEKRQFGLEARVHEPLEHRFSSAQNNADPSNIALHEHKSLGGISCDSHVFQPSLSCDVLLDDDIRPPGKMRQIRFAPESTSSDLAQPGAPILLDEARPEPAIPESTMRSSSWVY